MAEQLKANFRKVARDLVAKLEKTRARSIPYGVRDGLNTAAFKGREIWQGQMREKLTLRNPYTERSVRVEQAKGLDVAHMASKVGTIAAYMDTTEKGGTTTGAVPSTVASGEGRSQGPRKKLVRRPHKMGNITLANRRKPPTRRARNAAAIKQARKEKRKHVYLELGSGTGIFRISGSGKRGALDLVWATAKKTHTIPPTPTLAPALVILGGHMPRILRGAVLRQLQRAREWRVR